MRRSLELARFIFQPTLLRNQSEVFSLNPLPPNPSQRKLATWSIRTHISGKFWRSKWSHSTTIHKRVLAVEGEKSESVHTFPCLKCHNEQSVSWSRPPAGRNVTHRRREAFCSSWDLLQLLPSWTDLLAVYCTSLLTFKAIEHLWNDVDHNISRFRDPPTAPPFSGMGEQSHIHRRVGAIRRRGQTNWNGKSDCTATLYVRTRTGGKGNEKWVSRREIPNAPVLLLFYVRECVCVCAHQHSLGMLKVRTSGCGSICLINGAVMEWELGISALQWKRTSCRRLPCADKSSPATSASRTQRPGTNPVLHLCTVPFFHHTIISILLPYRAWVEGTNPPTATSTQPPLCTIMCSIIHPQPLNSNKNLFCLLLNSCYFCKTVFLEMNSTRESSFLDHAAHFLALSALFD